MSLTPADPSQKRSIASSNQGSTLADILERVLDKGIVIAGDVTVSVGGTELLNIRIRLLISSVDKAKEIGINWWENDPYLSSQAKVLAESNQKLLEQVQFLEGEVKKLKTLAESSVKNESNGDI